MAKQCNATQKKLLEILDSVFQGGDIKLSNNQFNFPCVNDHCSHLLEHGVRKQAIAWKNSTGYGIFCPACGQDNKLSREDFLEQKRKIENSFSKKSDIAA